MEKAELLKFGNGGAFRNFLILRVFEAHNENENRESTNGQIEPEAIRSQTWLACGAAGVEFLLTTISSWRTLLEHPQLLGLRSLKCTRELLPCYCIWVSSEVGQYE